MHSKDRATGAHLLRNYMTGSTCTGICCSIGRMHSIIISLQAGFHGCFLEVHIILLVLSLFSIAFIKFVL